MNIYRENDLEVIVVFGDSMEKHIGNDDKILFSKRKGIPNSLLRGDIALFKEPGNDLPMLKRIVGIPGDKIAFEAGTVKININDKTFILDEPYLLKKPIKNSQESFSWKLNHGEYILLGDNRSKSKDSRLFGKIFDSRIMGRVTGKLIINKINKEVLGVKFFDRYEYKKKGGILKAYPIKKKCNENF